VHRQLVLIPHLHERIVYTLIDPSFKCATSSLPVVFHWPEEAGKR
jgi:hypothetical protein